MKPFRFACFVILGSAGVLAALAIFAAACAHAATVVMDGAPAPVLATPASQGLPIAAWLMIALSALYSAGRIVRGLADLTGVIAKRTTNTVDDAIHEKLDKLADGLDEVVAIVKGVQPPPVVVVAPPAPATDAHTASTSPGTLTTIGMLAVLLLGAGMAPQFGCSTTKRVATAGKDAVVLCVKADTGPLLQLTGELGAAALASALHTGSPDWDALVAKAKAAGLEVGGCAFAALYHALDKEPEVAARSSTAAPDPRAAALEQLRATLGGGHWQLADGSVL